MSKFKHLQNYEVRYETTYETIAIFETLELAIEYVNKLKNKDEFYISTPSGENIYL